jgi:hypothetical protein
MHGVIEDHSRFMEHYSGVMENHPEVVKDHGGSYMFRYHEDGSKKRM